MFYECKKAENEGKEMREAADSYLDVNQYQPHSFDTPKSDKVYPPQNVEEMFTGVPYFFYKQGFDFSDVSGLQEPSMLFTVDVSCRGYSQHGRGRQRADTLMG